MLYKSKIRQLNEWYSTKFAILWKVWYYKYKQIKKTLYKWLELKHFSYLRGIKGGRNMSGQALGFMLTMWSAILISAVLSLGTVMRNDKKNN